MTYEGYLTKVRGLHSEVARFVDPILAAGEGLGSDALSACLAWRGGFPGFQSVSKQRDQIGRDYEARVRVTDRARGKKASETLDGFSFPGGNDGIMRAIVKWLNPEVIEGSTSFTDTHNRRIPFPKPWTSRTRPAACARAQRSSGSCTIREPPAKANPPPLRISKMTGSTPCRRAQ
jgi:hypothetical protein